jgi:GNAT superfamily N-acetyltransferase
METINVRSARRADLPMILRSIRALAAHEGKENEPPVTESDLAGAFFGDDAINEAVVIEHAELGSVGIAIFFTIFSTYHGKRGLHLEDFYIEPRARGRGIGGAFMRWLGAEARRRGCAALQWAVVDGNEGAIRFYERLGASRATGFYWYRLTGDAFGAVAGDGR